MVRVYLEDWEWDCCGDPFQVGDTVTLQVREPRDALRGMLGGALGSSLELTESHHEVDPDDVASRPLTGRVCAIAGIAIDHTEHLEPILPPPSPLAPEPVDPASSSGLGWFAHAPDARSPRLNEPAYTIVATPVDGTGRTVPVSRVPATARYGEPAADAGAPPAEPIVGYVVDLEPAGFSASA